MNQKLQGGAEILRENLEKRLGASFLNENDAFRFIHHSDFPNEPEKQSPLIRELKEDGRIKILWKHGNPHEMPRNLGSKEWQDLFDYVVFVSHWQAEKFHMYHAFPAHKTIVIPNAIEPIDWEKNKKTEKIRLTYISTPYRGLDVLLLALSGLKRYDWHLDVFSSLKIYGWSEEQDSQFKQLYDYCNEHPQITYHGSVPNHLIREILKESHILTYPSTFQETFCLSAIEAMSAGCEVITSNYGALPETCGKLSTMYQFIPNKEVHARKFLDTLNGSLDRFWDPAFQEKLQLQKKYIDASFSWDIIIRQWKHFFNDILKK